MKNPVNRLVLGAALTFLGVVSTPAANAQTERENSTFTVTEPTAVGSFTLDPGEYVIKVVVLESNRNMVQVTNLEQTKVYASVLATPHAIRQGEVLPSSRYIYYAAAPGQLRALRTWFARDSAFGQDIIYPKGRALEIAVAAKEPVIAIPEGVKETEYKSATLMLVTPEKEVKPYEPVAVPAPPVLVAEARPAKSLPRTASNVPLLGLLGLLSLGGGLALRALALRAA